MMCWYTAPYNAQYFGTYIVTPNVHSQIVNVSTNRYMHVNMTGVAAQRQPYHRKTNQTADFH